MAIRVRYLFAMTATTTDARPADTPSPLGLASEGRRWKTLRPSSKAIGTSGALWCCPIVRCYGAVSTAPAAPASYLPVRRAACAHQAFAQRRRRVPALVDLLGADRVFDPADVLADGADTLRAGLGRTRTVSSRLGLSSFGVTSSNRSGFPW